MNQAYPLSGYDVPLTRQNLPRGWIDGLSIANGTDATNDINVAAGVCRSTSNMANNGRSSATKDQIDIELDVSLVKQLDVTWEPGNGGMRHQTAIANATYHLFAIGGAGLKGDIWADTSLTPTPPSRYTAYRRIGSIIRSGAAILGFIQNGNYFGLKVPVGITPLSNPGTAAVLSTLTVPVGLKLQARAGIALDVGASAAYILITDPDSTDTAPSSTLAQTYAEANCSGGAEVDVFTDTSARIRTRVSASAASTLVTVTTMGWDDRRGRDA